MESKKGGLSAKAREKRKEEEKKRKEEQEIIQKKKDADLVSMRGNHLYSEMTLPCGLDDN